MLCEADSVYGVGTVLLAEQCGSVVQSEKWFIGGAGGQTLRAMIKS